MKKLLILLIPLLIFGQGKATHGSSNWFDGIDDSITIANTVPLFTGATAGSVIFWYKSDSIIENAGFFNVGGPANRTFWIWIGFSNKDTTFFQIGDQAHFQSLRDYPRKDWRMIAITKNENTGYEKIYCNGDSLSAWVDPDTFLSTEIPRIIAKISGYTTVKANMKNIQVYRRTLPTFEIKWLYNHPEKIYSTDSLKLWLPLSEYTGTVAGDSSGNANNGTISGATWNIDTPVNAAICPTAFKFAVVNTQTIAGQFSTMTGKTISVDWGDGGARSTYTGTDQAYSKNYGSAGNRTVKIYLSQCLTKFTMTTSGAVITFNLADLPAGLTYFNCSGSNTVSGSLADLPAGLTYFNCYGSNTVSGSLADLPAGLTYFNCYGFNTVSGSLADLPAGLTSFNCGGFNTISGSLADLPAGLTYFACSGSNTISGSLADLPAGLTYFACSGYNTVSGSLADLPAGLTYFNCSGSNTVADYTTKTWTTKPATFNFVPTGVGGLSEAEINQLLIDFDEDLVWAAGNAITLTGTNAAPTGLGIDAKNHIISEGATVTTN